MPFVVFGHDLQADVRAALARVSARRVLVLAPPSRRFVDRVTAAFDGVAFEVFAQARVHVPAEIVTTASDAVRTFEADTLVTVGGGSATGLGKALCLEHALRFIAIPTTYAGSEQTDIYGIKTGGDKKTGRDPRVRPDVVLYEASLTVDLPPKLTTQSLMNALAHPISALSTGSLEDAAYTEALQTVRQIMVALRQLADDPHSEPARLEALRATARAAGIIDAGKLGTHHRIAHFLGGRFGLDHAAVHSMVLVHTVAGLANDQPKLYAELTEAAQVDDLPSTLLDLLHRAGAETSLSELGVEPMRLDKALRERPDLPKAQVRRTLFRHPNQQDETP